MACSSTSATVTIQEAAPEFADTAAAAAHWEAVARRTRAVSEQWRALHVAEEARADEARAVTSKAAHALRKAEEDRDAAEKRAEAASKALTVAKGEQTRWRARSDAQTASKTFLLLEDTRAALRERDAELASTSRALANLQNEFDTYKATRKREDAEKDLANREDYDALMRRYEDCKSDAEQFEGQADKVRSELTGQLATSPPGALAEAQLANSRAAATIQQLEAKNMTLRREASRWRDRARGALASERLIQLSSSAAAMPWPATSGGVTRGLGGNPFADGPSSASEAADEMSRLRAEVGFWKEEAEYEKQRQKSFHSALWASDVFSQAQKIRAMSFLRDPPGMGRRASDVDDEDPFLGLGGAPPSGPAAHPAPAPPPYGQPSHARRPVTVPTGLGMPKPLFPLSARAH